MEQSGLPVAFVNNLSDSSADAPAVLDGHLYISIHLTSGKEIGVGRKVAQVGFLGTHLLAAPFQVHRGATKDVTVLAAHHRTHRIRSVG